MDVQVLPKAVVGDTLSLPTSRGIYFVIDDSYKVLYVGKSENIRRRWYDHHRMPDLEGRGFHVAYMVVGADVDLLALERSLIKAYKPDLNERAITERLEKPVEDPTLEGSFVDLKAHLVLTTKYRRKVFTAEMLQRLTGVVGDLCEKWDCKLIEVNGEADHIHLLFQYYPQMALPKFINNLKSVSSRRLRAEFAERVNKFYWKSVLWNESYFIASCGGVTVSALRRYIEQQDSPDLDPMSYGQAAPTEAL